MDVRVGLQRNMSMDYEKLFRVQHREKKTIKYFLKYKEEVNTHRLLIKIQRKDCRRIKQEGNISSDND